MMKRRIFTAVLAAAMVLSLAACGGGGGTSSSNPGSSSANGSSSSQPDGSVPDGSTPDGSSPDASTPDDSIPTGGSAGGSVSSAEGSQVTLTLNRTSIELNKAGATFRLRYTAEPDTDGIPSFTSSDPKVATVAEDGTVTAVAPGKATVTVTYDGATATASVNCNWKVSQPAPALDTSKPSGGSSSSGGTSSSGGSSSSAPAAQVDLSSFYTTITGKYQFSFMMEADSAMLDNFFSGLSGLTLSQQMIYLCGMSPSPHGDFALVQVSDSKDAATVKNIFQARIDYMVGDGNGPGGAFYPMEQTMWEENARIVSNGDYVMLIVHENADDIANEFNALF